MTYRLDLLQRCFAVAAASVFALGTTTGRAAIISVGQTASLSQLIGGDTIVVGDKVFSGFAYTPNGDMPLPQDVSVTGLISGNSVLLQFSGAFRDQPGGSTSDAGLSFDVQVTDPNKFITQVNLAGTLTTIGDTAEVHIDESFLGLPAPGAGMFIQRQFVNGVPSPFNRNEDSVNFQDALGVPGFKSFRVLKDIFADAGSATFNAARVTTFVQEFEQEQIPEPATFVLAGLSGLALVAIRRCRHA